MEHIQSVPRSIESKNLGGFTRFEEYDVFKPGRLIWHDASRATRTTDDLEIHKMNVDGVHSWPTRVYDLPEFHSALHMQVSNVPPSHVICAQMYLRRPCKNTIVHIVEINTIYGPLCFTALLELEDVIDSGAWWWPNELAVQNIWHVAVVAGVADGTSNDEHHDLISVLELVDMLNLHAIHKGEVLPRVRCEVNDNLVSLAHTDDNVRCGHRTLEQARVGSNHLEGDEVSISIG